LKTLRLLIAGRVQGVGYRDWMVGEAALRGVSGWVRNLGDAQVEAVVQGDDDAVATLIAACKRGPVYAQVSAVTATADRPVAEPGFVRLPSA
jgi:acylphosphatase